MPLHAAALVGCASPHVCACACACVVGVVGVRGLMYGRRRLKEECDRLKLSVERCVDDGKLAPPASEQPGIEVSHARTR